MNYIFISPQFPPNFKYFVQRLKAAGVTVLGIGSDAAEQLDPELLSALETYVHVNNMEHYDEVYRSVAYLAHRYGKIDRLESHNEYWLELDAALRTDFNIWGLKSSDIHRIKHKSEMKKVFKRLGIEFAPGTVFDTEDQAFKAVRKLGYPVVVKPDKGVGAAFTYRINSDEELKTFFQHKPPMTFIMESFIDADIVTYDGLTDQNGDIVFENSLVYDSGVMDNVVLGKDMYYYTARTIDPKLKAMGQACVEAFGLKERFFHFEFFKRKDGSYLALEINVRPPGGMTMDMFNYANDHDFFDSYARLVAGLPIDIPHVKPYFVLYIGLKEHNFDRHVLSFEDVNARYGDLIVFQGPIASIFAPAIGNFTYILRSLDEAVVLKAAQEILALKARDA